MALTLVGDLANPVRACLRLLGGLLGARLASRARSAAARARRRRNSTESSAVWAASTREAPVRRAVSTTSWPMRLAAREAAATAPSTGPSSGLRTLDASHAPLHGRSRNPVVSRSSSPLPRSGAHGGLLARTHVVGAPLAAIVREERR